MRKKIILIFTIIMVVILCSTIINNKSEKANDVIIVGIAPDNPPFEYIKQNNCCGVDVDLIKEIASRLNKKIIFKYMEFNTLIPKLMIDEIDIAISSMSITKKRSTKVDFSIPYFKDSFVLLYKNKKDLISTKFKYKNLTQISSIEEIRDLTKHDKIGVQSGSEMEEYLFNTIDTKQILALPNVLTLITSLMQDDIQYILIDSIATAKTIQQRYPIINYLPMSLLPPKKFAIAFKKHSKLKKDIDDIINILNKEQFFETRLEKHLPDNK